MNKVSHRKVSGKSDGPDATEIQPSNWNDTHRIGIELTNRTGGTLVSGDVVGLTSGFDESVALHDVLDTLKPLVIAMENIDNDAVGMFASTGAWTVKVIGATTRGNYLAKHGTTKAAYDTGLAATSNVPPAGAFAIALTGSGGAGTVVAHLLTTGASSSGGWLTYGGNVASAAALSIGNSSTVFHVTGTTSISSIGTRPAGHLLILVFDDVLDIVHGPALILPGDASHTTSPGEIVTFISEGSGNWRQVAVDRTVLTALVTGTLVANTSVSVGSPAASAGAIRMANLGDIKARNAANDGDITVLAVNVDNKVVLGNGDAKDIIAAGQLRADVQSTARVVLPVGADKWATE